METVYLDFDMKNRKHFFIVELQIKQLSQNL